MSDTHGGGGLLDPATPGSLEQAEAPPRYRVATFGDSLMWGQGIPEERKFSHVIMKALARRHGLPGTIAYGRPRSGAHIDDGIGSSKDEFVDTFPSLFASDQAEKNFLRGDESVASQLFGEIPTTYPTVIDQVRSLSDELGATINLSLVCGGANDIDFEAILDPRENSNGAFERVFGPPIREICYGKTLDLLSHVRRKTPNATILLFGYYPPMTYRSDPKAIKEFFRHESGRGSVAWWINGKARRLGIPGAQDIGSLVREAAVRSVWAHGLSTYWLRAAVTQANVDDATRGPGIVFVPCGFGPRNGAFAPQSLVHQDYTDPTHDSVRDERARRIPRVGLLDDMRELRIAIPMSSAGLRPFPEQEIRRLRDALDGPKSLRAAMKPDDFHLDATMMGLAKEIYRIQHALIASMFHPTVRGANRYADVAEVRYAAHRAAIASIPRLVDPRPSTPVPEHKSESMEERLVRFGLRSAAPLRADVGHAFLDAVRVTVRTSSDSTKNLALDLFLLLVLNTMSGRHYDTVFVPLSLRRDEASFSSGAVVSRKYLPELEPGGITEFSVDVTGHAPGADGLRLDTIAGAELVMSNQPHVGKNHVWIPEQITLDINGTEVVRRTVRDTRLGSQARFDLRYPGPAPSYDVTILRSTAIRVESLDRDGLAPPGMPPVVRP